MTVTSSTLRRVVCSPSLLAALATGLAVGTTPQPLSAQEDQPAQSRPAQNRSAQGADRQGGSAIADDNTQRRNQRRQGAMLGVLAGDVENLNGQQGTAGVVIQDVMPEGPAAQANIRRGDILRSIGGQQITSTRQLTDWVDRMEPGAKVEVVVVRNGQRFETQATLGDAAKLTEDEQQTRGFRGIHAEKSSPDDPWLGVWLTESQQRNAQGAMIGRVYPTSPAAEADLEDGDRILEADGKPVTSPQQFIALVDQYKVGDKLTLKVQREGRDQPREVEVALSRRGDFLNDNDLTQGQTQDYDDAMFDVPDHVMRMEHERRTAMQAQRMEGLMLQVLREVRELKQEVEALKGASQ